jgi:hypothetical protein
MVTHLPPQGDDKSNDLAEKFTEAPWIFIPALDFLSKTAGMKGE